MQQGSRKCTFSVEEPQASARTTTRTTTPSRGSWRTPGCARRPCRSAAKRGRPRPPLRMVGRPMPVCVDLFMSPFAQNVTDAVATKWCRELDIGVCTESLRTAESGAVVRSSSGSSRGSTNSTSSIRGRSGSKCGSGGVRPPPLRPPGTSRAPRSGGR